jgi:hypothetical protein
MLADDRAGTGDRVLGSAGSVRTYLHPLRELGTAPQAAPTTPKVREVTNWMLRHPASLDTDEQLKLKQVPTRYPTYSRSPAGSSVTWPPWSTA